MTKFARLALSYLGWLGLALYLIFGTPGCTGSRQDRWTPEPELMAPAMQAMEDWCLATDGRYCPQLARDGNPIRFADESTAPEDKCGWAMIYASGPVLIEVVKSSILSGGCDFDGGNPEPASAEHALVSLLRHELGHAGRLDDVTDSARIMHWDADSAGEITDADVDAMAAANGW